MKQSARFRAKEKGIAGFLSLLMCFSVIPTAAFADAANAEHGSTIETAAVGDEAGEENGEDSQREILSPEDEELVGGPALGADSVIPAQEIANSNDGASPLTAYEASDSGEQKEDAACENVESEGAGASLSDAAGSKPALGFVYIDEAAPMVGDRQNVAFALSDEGVCLESATLRFATLHGENKVESSQISGNAALFEIDCSESGEYELLGVEFALLGSDKSFYERFGDGEYCFEVQGLAEADGVDVTALTLDEGGNVVEAIEAQDAIEEAMEKPATLRSAVPSSLPAVSSSSGRAASYPGVVVALDPGHGGSDSGATGNGLLEKNLTLSIAKYCQSALQRNGVNVFMTRATDVYVGLSERVQRAAAAGASVFVSIHINSATPAAYGCEVWVPNDSSYKHDVHVAGKTLGEKVIAKLAALGLHNRGIKYRDSENGSKYPDGSVADYYSVINGARQRGIPGIIVEHAFISNSGDALKMKSEAFLKKLGEADAQGIIEAINGGVIKGTGQLYNDGKGYRYRTSSGADLRNDWVSVNGHRYYMGSDGYAARWSQKIDGSWYYFTDNCQMYTGLLTWYADGLKSYYGADGKRVDGWVKLSGRWHYFFPSTGKSARWSQKIGDYWYYFDGQSRMHTGWLTWNADGRKSYFDSLGHALVGWQTLGGKRYYFDEKGRSARWSQKIDGSWYYFTDNCQMYTGLLTWYADGLKSYYGADGKRVDGWVKLSGRWHYFFPSTGKSARWSQKIGDYWYYFDGQSRMHTGWLTWNADGRKSYFDSLGHALVGWQTLGGKRYYFDEKGRSARWTSSIEGETYYFDSQGVQHQGWLTWNADGSKSYFDPANGGAMVTGQATIDGTLYDFGSDGKIRNMIMGSPRTTVDAMVRDFKSQGKSYLSQVYTAKGAPTIESFCKILYEEATAEGVRPAVLYAQVMLETGWLQFKGSSVKPEQCNFGGIGATDKDPKPATFADVRTGLRAQVQHLKAYGSTEALKNPCVDPRFHLVKRGVAPYVADLAGRWASDKEYGIKLNKLIDRVAS